MEEERLWREVIEERFAATSDTEARGRAAALVFASPFVGDAIEARGAEVAEAVRGFVFTEEDNADRTAGGLEEGAREARLDGGGGAGLDIVGLAVALLAAEALVDFFTTVVAAGLVDEGNDALAATFAAPAPVAELGI